MVSGSPRGTYVPASFIRVSSFIFKPKIPSNERSGMIVKQIMHVERGTLTVGEPQYDKGPASPTLGSLTSPCAEPFLVAIFGRSNAYLRNVRSRFGSFDIFPRFEHISSAPASFGVASCG
ncbi:hypothetical protein PISMIDRAFT_676941, partial [Pisolithus microcarpus 441]